MLEIGKKIHGFTVNEAKAVPTLSATLYTLSHEKSGARMVFIDREDINKTFSIAFKTIPTDSTGVFHIIEHSVLCGSKKYPVKEPFVELLKSSLQTFLNAMTFPDKTMYPVASRNDKDFLNLVSVYMDAVLHPAILENPNIFRQEGWHYEIEDKEGKIKTSGVVLNEMRGVFSSADELASYHVKDMLYPDTAYRFESGGKPEFITDLTYEEFCSEHRKYYHPSNAELFLDGSVNLSRVLPLLDSYLSEYDACECNFEIGEQKRPSHARREAEYEIDEGESATDKTRLTLGFLGARFDEQERGVAISVLLDAVASSNESPLKKALLSSGLVEDVCLIPCDSIQQNSVSVDFKNVKDGKTDELYKLFLSEVSALAARGIERDLLLASLNSFEFKVREKDYGTLPIGIVNAMAVLESSLYGGDPAQNLSYEDSFAGIREKLEHGYFEKLLIELFIDNPNTAYLILTPSSELGKRRAELEEEKMRKIKEKFTDGELDRVISEYKKLTEWQKVPDSEEGLATIPTLRISDISEELERIPREVTERDSVTVLRQDIATSGIVYAELFFDSSDLSPSDLFDLKLLTYLYANVRTDSHGAIELQNLIKRDLGSFDFKIQPLTKDGETKIYTNLSASFLESKKDAFAELLSEILYTSLFDEREALKNIVRQTKLGLEESVVSAGHSVGFGRACASFSREGAINEYTGGYEFYCKIREFDADFDASYTSFLERVPSLIERVFTRERLTLSLTCGVDEEFEETLIKSVREGEKCAPVCEIMPFGKLREGIQIPAQVAFATVAYNLGELSERSVGSLGVVRNLLSYGYLWGEIRVQGGAYGAGFISRNNGNVGFYSYRDPSPKRSVDVYFGAPASLCEFAESGEDITKFIISALGDSDPLLTPRLKGAVSATRYLRGITREDEMRTRREILSTDSAELGRIAGVLERALAEASICIVAGKDKLSESGDYIDKIIKFC